MWHLMRCLGGWREGIVGRLRILAAVALGRVRTALGFVEIGVLPGAGDVAKRARLADVRRQRRRRLGTSFMCAPGLGSELDRRFACGLENVCTLINDCFSLTKVVAARAMN